MGAERQRIAKRGKTTAPGPTGKSCARHGNVAAREAAGQVSHQPSLDPRYVSPANVLALQRTIGNVAVNRLVRQWDSTRHVDSDHGGPGSLPPIPTSYSSAAIRREPDHDAVAPVQRITRGSGWGTAWKLWTDLLPADAALWERIRAAVEDTLPARLLTLAGLATAVGRATPANVTTAITTLRQHQQTANGRTLNYADAARLDQDSRTWIQTADDHIRDLRAAQARRVRVDDAARDLASVLGDLGAAPSDVRTRRHVDDARTQADRLRNQVVNEFDPAEATVRQFEGAVRNLGAMFRQALDGYIRNLFREEGERIGQVVEQLTAALGEAEVPGGGDTGRGALAGLRQSLNDHVRAGQPATVAALNVWTQTAVNRRGQAASDLAAVAAAALREGRAVIAARTTARLTHYTANVTPWLTLLPVADAQRLGGIEAEYRAHAVQAPTATLADLVRRNGQLDQLDIRYGQAQASARLADLAALTPAHLLAARGATSDALVARALTGMTTPQLQASGDGVLQYLAAHGAALAPLLPRYHPSFAYRASPAGLNVTTAGEFTVLGWFRGEQGTMAGTIVQLNNPGITRHGGHNFAVNFDHFVDVHLARYADAAELQGRANDTTFYPDTVTAATFIANQLQPALNAWPDMAALVQAINNATPYNRRFQLTQGGFTFELRAQATDGRGSLTQCFPIAPGGGAIQLTAARTRAAGQLLALLQ